MEELGLDGSLRLIVRSEKVARVVEYELPLMTAYGKVGVERRRATVYDYVLDERQTRALKQARELASGSGLRLEVTDITREGTLKRFVRLASGRMFKGSSESFGAPERRGGSRPTDMNPRAFENWRA